MTPLVFDVVKVLLPGVEVIVYVKIALPPFEEGTDQLIFAEPDDVPLLAIGFKGALGTVRGTADTTLELGL